MNTLALFRIKLCRIRESFGGFLTALNSYVSLFFHTSPSTKHHTINMKCSLDGACKQIGCKPCIYRLASCFVERTTALPGSHPSKRGTSIGSLRADHTSAKTILFHMGGNFFIRLLVGQLTDIDNARILILSLMAIARIISEIVSWNEVTMK